MLAFLLHGLPAFAQGEAAPVQAGAVQAPELIERAEAVYPQEPRAQRLEGKVVLRLTIDREGRVTEAEVMEGAAHGFGEAARDAALRSRFRPAQQGGQAVAVRILFSYEFKLPA